MVVMMGAQYNTFKDGLRCWSSMSITRIIAVMDALELEKKGAACLYS